MYVTASKDGAIHLWDGINANCVHPRLGHMEHLWPRVQFNQGPKVRSQKDLMVKDLMVYFLKYVLLKIEPLHQRSLISQGANFMCWFCDMTRRFNLIGSFSLVVRIRL